MTQLNHKYTLIYWGDQVLGEVYFVRHSQGWYAKPEGHVCALEGSFATPEQALHALISYHQTLLRNQIEHKLGEIDELRTFVNRLEGSAFELNQIADDLRRCGA